MHTPARNRPIVRTLLSLAVLLLMLASPLAAVLPAGGVLVEEVDALTLPAEWTLEGGGGADFDVTLPAGQLTRATLEMEGSGVEVEHALEQDVDEWTDGAISTGEGVDLSGGAIEAATEHLNVAEGPGDLGSNEPMQGVTVDGTVTLSLTSPDFTGANGDFWRYYIPVEISLNTGTWERDTLTVIHLDIPGGHCKEVTELRVADPMMNEVPLQVLDRATSTTDGTVVFVELLFRSDMPPEGSRVYRVYYGNPSAQDPNYDPLLLGAELWNYDSILDADFLTAWNALRWTGGNGAGWGWTRFTSIGGNSKTIDQTVTVNAGRAFSQVWTSTGLKHDDFQLTTWVSGFSHDGPPRSEALWALDFRVQGSNCYRLMYTESNINNTVPQISLRRVSGDRHLTDANASATWTKLDELAVEPMGDDRSIPIRIRCVGDNIDIWVGDMSDPALRARDQNIDIGQIGTFVGGVGVGLTSVDTKVGCSVGPLLLLPPDINLTDKSHAYFLHGERQQHETTGTWVSDTYELPGARDALLSLDISLPYETKYGANLLSATDDHVLVPGLRDGDQVPEEALDGPFKLQVIMDSEDDSVTPELRGWGVGYRAVVNPRSDRGVAQKDQVAVGWDGVSLTPSRDLWLKDDLPVIKNGNIDEDAAGVTMGSVVPYGSGYRVYYTGTSATGELTICVAVSIDGQSYSDYIPILGGASTGFLPWDSVRHSPKVLFLGDVWLMYYVGELFTSQVGLALSGNGFDFTPLDTPVLRPSGSGFDEHAILDFDVILHNNLYMMYYTGMDHSMNATAIGYAFSGDGGTWTRSPNNPVLKPGPGSSDWDRGYVRSPCVVAHRDQYVMYYLGGTGSDPATGKSSVGYATSSTGTGFKRSPSNPVLEPRVGGVANDHRGIKSLVVFEDTDGPFSMVYTGQGTDWALRVFEARSGYVTDGYYITKPFHLDRRPEAFSGLKVDAEVPDGTTVDVSLRTSADGSTWSEWQGVSGGSEWESLPTEEFFQLRMDLASEFMEDTPTVRGLVLDYESCVRFSTITVMPVNVPAETFISVVAELSGEALDDVETSVHFPDMGWSDVAIYGGHGRYGTGPDFGYRFNLSSPPARLHRIDNATFSLVFVSLPSDVAVDVGADGTAEMTHPGPVFEGQHELNVTEAVGDWVDANGDGASDITVPFRVTTATPGILSLLGVSFLVNTPPVITAREPATEDVYLDEGANQKFSLAVEEQDGDPLEYAWYVGTEVVGHEHTYTFEAEVDEDTDDPDPVVLKVEVSDGTSTTEPVQWTVHVSDTTVVPNQLPHVEDFGPEGDSVSVDENESMDFWVTVVDPDSGPRALNYTWYVNDTEMASGPEADGYTFDTDYESAGTYEVRVVASDGEAQVEQGWDLTVKNVKEPGTGPNGNGNGEEDDPGVNWLPLLLVLVIIGVAAAGGVMYTRGQRGGAGADAASAGEEVVTADVPLEPELEPATPSPEPPVAEPPTAEPSFTETAKVGREVASGPGAQDAAKAGAAAGAAVLPMADMDKDRTFVVEEVYVVYNDGRLMCHKARAERTSVDTDLFGGMFTAIQQFIHDSMGGTAGTGTQVGRLDYGENRILVERGNYVFLGAIIFGEEQESLREAMRDAVSRIEGSYAGVIERWTGDQTQLSGVGAFVAPLIGLTQDLNREAIVSRTRTVGVKMLSEVEFFQGFVRLKVAVRNDTKTVITNVATDIVYDSNVLRVDRIQPEYPVSGTKVTLGTIGPREKKTVAYYLDPLICQESDIDGTTSYKDAEGVFGTVTMKRRRADIVCPIFFTEENANTAMLKRLIHEELKESDSKLFTIPKMLKAPDAFALGKEVIRGHDVRFVREFVEEEEGQPYRAEAWYYGVTKVKKDKMVIRTSIWEDRRTIEFFVAAGRMESITGLLAELGQNLNNALKDKYLGRASATLVVDPEQQEEVKGLGLLIDKYSEGEMAAGEVDQQR